MTIKVHVITKSVVLCLYSEPKSFIEGFFFFEELHYATRRFFNSFSQEKTKLQVKKCFLLALLTVTIVCVDGSLKE